MPAPRLGQKVFDHPKSADLDSATEELLHVEQAEEIGSISRDALKNMLDEVPPPPWEVDPAYNRHDSDARKFLEAPANITLRWLNPKIVSQSSMRDWKAVPAKGDPRFVLKLKSMRAPDNTVRRGDHNGDFLAWMYTAWVESRAKLKRDRVDRRSGQAGDRALSTQEAYRRGKFSRYVTSPEPGREPTDTLADGRSLGRD